MPSSRDKILTSATECFFQHGYSTASISMVGRYANISRVTIHKQFKSKEALFRAVVESHFASKNVLLEKYTHSTNDFWLETEALILNRSGELFEEISCAIVRSDLLHAGQSYCQDILQANEIKVRECISHRISKELTDRRMTLSKIDMSIQELSRLIETAPLGLALSSLDESSTDYVKQLMKVFRASTSI